MKVKAALSAVALVLILLITVMASTNILLSVAKKDDPTKGENISYEKDLPDVEANYYSEPISDEAYGATNPSYRSSNSSFLKLPDDKRNWPPIVPPEYIPSIDG